MGKGREEKEDSGEGEVSQRITIECSNISEDSILILTSLEHTNLNSYLTTYHQSLGHGCIWEP